MIQFDNIKYERFDYEQIKKKISDLTSELKLCSDKEEFLNVFKKINDIAIIIESNCEYAEIRNSRDLDNQYYDEEVTFWNNNKDSFDLLFTEIYEICDSVSFKEELYDVIPENFFHTIRFKLKTTSSIVSDERKHETLLLQKYKKLITTKIAFHGELYNMAGMRKFLTDSDRDIRKEANDVCNDFFLLHQNEFDDIFEDLVKTRNKIATKLGYDNYAQMSCYLLRRFGYGYNEIEKFRENIIKYILPINDRLSDIQRKNLGVDTLTYYDTIFYKEGNPTPLFLGNELLEKHENVFGSVSNEIRLLYKEMLDNGYIDLLNRQNKVLYSITNYLTREKMPVITGNFKNTSADITTICHEMGHSYQKYLASINEKDMIIPPMLKYPTFEVAEIFSYAIELMVLPELTNFFSEEDYKKYCYLKIRGILGQLPYIALVDHFQQEIYSNVNYNSSDYHRIWNDLATLYGNKVSNVGHPNLDAGNYFFRQNHIFLNPFYYIDYGISYFGSLSLWQSFETNKKDGLNKYRDMAKEASNIPLLSIINKYHLPNPFEEETFVKLAAFLESKLDEYEKQIDNKSVQKKIEFK